MKVAYERRGSGTPLVLVHGLGSRWEVWEPVLDDLAARHDVVAVDLPGFGLSPADPAVVPGPYGYAEWLAEFVGSLGIERPHVVGNSMGGGVALEMGRAGTAERVTVFSPIGFWRRPGRIWTQSLLTTMRVSATRATGVMDQVMQRRPSRSVALSGFFGHPSRVGLDEARRHIDGLVSGPAFPQACASFSHYDLAPDDDLGKLGDIPVTIAWGTRDVTLIHRTQSARARECLPLARHVDLPGCGHLPFSDDPELCAGIILEDS